MLNISRLLRITSDFCATFPDYFSAHLDNSTCRGSIFPTTALHFPVTALHFPITSLPILITPHVGALHFRLLRYISQYCATFPGYFSTHLDYSTCSSSSTFPDPQHSDLQRLDCSVGCSPHTSKVNVGCDR